jgi:hypothetical protein
MPTGPVLGAGVGVGDGVAVGDGVGVGVGVGEVAVGTETVTSFDAGLQLLEVSRARTTYVYVSPAVTDVSVKVVPVKRPISCQDVVDRRFRQTP